MIIIYFLLVLALIFLFIGHYKRAEISISPIFGVMFGFLYSKEHFESTSETTLQCTIGLICLTIIWENQQTGLE